MRRHILLCSTALLLAWSQRAPAQAAPNSGASGAPGGLCYRARPRPACSAFVLTNFGSYVVLGRDETGGEVPLLAVADWGLMFNVSARDAIGASVFARAGPGGFSLGPAVRYRRWMGRSESVEVAVGVPLAPSNMDTQSVFGLVKWSPNHWFAIAARPEFVRQTSYMVCVSFSPTPCSPGSPVSEVRVRLSLGVETGWVPGLALTGASSVAYLLAIVAYFAAHGD